MQNCPRNLKKLVPYFYDRPLLRNFDFSILKNGPFLGLVFLRMTAVALLLMTMMRVVVVVVVVMVEVGVVVVVVVVVVVMVVVDSYIFPL